VAKREKKNKPQLGKQPPRYRFFLNPYEDVRFSSCPQCTDKTGQRKLPLFIHIDPDQPFLLNKTCRYCAHCDLLIAHQNDLEDVLARTFVALNPHIVGNDYLVIGTLDRADWKRINQNQLSIPDAIEALHDAEGCSYFQANGWLEEIGDSFSSSFPHPL
jgi:hypothetical protein